MSAETDLAAARQSLAGTLAKAWFIAIESRLQREIALQMVADAQQAVEVSQNRLRVGIGNELDVTLAQQTLQTAHDSVSQLDLAYREAVRAVEMLTGRYPGAQLEATQTLAALTDQVPAGLPSELLERRLDVRAAEHRIAAAFSQVEEARAAKLPTITLSGGLSHISSDLFVLDNREDIVESIGGTVYLPIFNGDQLTAQVEARTAQQHYAVALWAQTGLRAFAEVEKALSTETSLRDREPILATQVGSGRTRTRTRARALQGRFERPASRAAAADADVRGAHGAVARAVRAARATRESVSGARRRFRRRRRDGTERESMNAHRGFVVTGGLLQRHGEAPLSVDNVRKGRTFA